MKNKFYNNSITENKKNGNEVVLQEIKTNLDKILSKLDSILSK